MGLPDASTDASPSTVFGLEEDPGPVCTDCTQQDGYEVMPVVDFEDGYGTAWFKYGEPGIPMDPGGANVPSPIYWGIQAADLNTLPGGPRCKSRYALHMQGGRFISWGGGYVTRFFNLRGEYAEQVCGEDGTTGAGGEGSGSGGAGADGTTRPGRITPDGCPAPSVGNVPNSGDLGACGFYVSPVINETALPCRRGLDVSRFDGLSFWARRSPGGSSSLRVALLDNNTSEDAALAKERAGETPSCSRVVKCCDGECNDVMIRDTADSPPVLERRCWSPIDGVPPFRTDPVDQMRWTDFNNNHKLCCPTVEQDPVFGGKECTPYVFLGDESSGKYCWNPGDPPLPEKNRNRCGDGFEVSVVIDTEWKFFRIPWSDFRRFTPNTRPIDPTGIWQLSLYFGAGHLDMYVDDFGFYRKQR